MHVCVRLNISETNGDRELFPIGSLPEVPEGSRVVTLLMKSHDPMT